MPGRGPITIVIGITIVLGSGVGIYYAVSSVIDFMDKRWEEHFGPRISLIEFEASQGECVEVCRLSFVICWQRAFEQTVLMHVTLSNDGNSHGRAVVTFLIDGKIVDSEAFFVGAGEVVDKVHSVVVEGCGEHHYAASIEDVQRA